MNNLLDNAKMTKHHSGVFVVNNKLKYQLRTGYHLDKEMDKIFNDLSEIEMRNLYLDFQEYRKQFNKFVEITSIDELTAALPKFTTNKNPLISKIISISQEHFPFTDYRYSHVDDLIRINIENQILRRKYRELFGNKAEKLFSHIYQSEVIRPK